MSDAQPQQSAEEIEALKARIAELESTTPRRRFDGRGFSAWVLLVVAAILLPIALTAFWAQRTLTDTERYVQTVAPLSQDESIQNAVAEKVSDVLITQLDAQNRIDALLTENLPDRPRLQALAGPLASAVNSLIESEVQKIVSSPEFSSVWETINRQAQQALVKVLSGDLTGAVTIQGDQVVLDTGDLIEIVKQRLVDRGLSFAANIPVPPAADREIVLLTSPQLQRLQTAYAIGQPVAQWLIYAVLLLFVVAILVSRHRARMVLATGVAILIGMVVLRLGLAWGENEVSLTLQGTPFAQAEQAFFTILTYFLITAVRAGFVLGIVLAALGWYFSGTSAAVATRTYLGGALSGASSRAAGGPLGEIGGWVARTRTFWRVAIVLVAIGVLLLSSPLTGSTILWTTVIAVLALVVVEFLAAAGGAGRATDDTAEQAVEADAPDEAASTSAPT